MTFCYLFFASISQIFHPILSTKLIKAALVIPLYSLFISNLWHYYYKIAGLLTLHIT